MQRIETLYSRAIAQIPNCQEIYIIAAAHIKSNGSKEGIANASNILEKGRKTNPTADRVWLESIKLAFQTGDEALGQKLARRD